MSCTVPNTYIAGQVVVLTDTITNQVGTLTDDPTDQVIVYKPDGTTVAPGVNHLSTGVYNAQLTVDLHGWWEYVWKSTGAAAGAGRSRFYVAEVP